MNLIERWNALPMWAKIAIAFVVAVLILKAFGYVELPVTPPGLEG